MPAAPAVGSLSRCVCRVLIRRHLSAPAFRLAEMLMATSALEIALPDSTTERATIRQTRADRQQPTPRRFKKFTPSKFGLTLEALLQHLDTGSITVSDIAKTDLYRLTYSCEQWTDMRLISERAADDLHAVLRAHSRLQLPLSSALRANARRWLGARCSTLSPDQLFPFFGHLPTLISGDAELAESCTGASLQIARCRRPDMDLLAQVVQQTHRHINQASVGDLTRFLADFAHLRINPAWLKRTIFDEIFTKFTQDCGQLLADEILTITDAVELFGLKPADSFWAAIGKQFDRVTPRETRQLMAKVERLEANQYIPSETSTALQFSLVASLVSELKELELSEWLMNVHKMGPTLEKGLHQLTNNAQFWPVLLRRAPTVDKSDRNAVLALIRVLMWAPPDCHTKVDNLLHSIAFTWNLSDEIFEALRKTDFHAPSTTGKRFGRQLREYLNQASASRLKCQFQHDNQQWHPLSAVSQPVEDIFHGLSSLPSMAQPTSFSPPTVQWWLSFRQRLHDDAFLPSAENWTRIMLTVSRLSKLQQFPDGQKDCERKYLLPPDWYQTFLELATNFPLLPGDLSPVKSLFGLLRTQRIQFNAERQRVAAASLLERYCKATDQFGSVLVNALELGLPVSPVVWQRVEQVKPQVSFSANVVHQLVDLAASYWALQLPGAPPASVLHQLLPTNHTSSRQQKLRLLLGDDFMPSEKNFILLAQRITSQKTPVVNGVRKLEQSLMKQDKAVRVEKCVSLPIMRSALMAGRTVDYLLYKSDGTQVVYLHDEADDKYWLMPSDVQGGQTVELRAYIYTLQKAGYKIGKLDKKRLVIQEAEPY